MWGHMILKPARRGHETPWHQDEAYWTADHSYAAVGAWMPLDDASIESGCLHFVPGSHLGPVLSHHHIGHDPSVHGLEADDADTTNEVAVPIPPGAATFHHPRMLHYAGPNTTGQPRRAYANEFQLAPVPSEVRQRAAVDRRGPQGLGRAHNHAMNLTNPAYIDPSLDSRAVTFENPTGGRGAGGTAHDGRKGAPNMRMRARRVGGARRRRRSGDDPPHLDDDPSGAARGHAVALDRGLLRRPRGAERVGAVRRLLRPPARPARRVPLRVDGGAGRAAASTATCRCRSASTCASWSPTADRGRSILYYQVDYTLGPRSKTALGYLHVGFRRENPTVHEARLRHRRRARRARVASSGARSACACIDAGDWYGEGEVKVYRDGDDELPTICGTGLEDYVGSAWGMGAHSAPYGGAPLVIGEPAGPMQPDFVDVLPVARARPDHVRDRSPGHDPADRREVLPARWRGRARGVRAHRTRWRERAGSTTTSGDSSRGASPSASTTTARCRTSTAGARKQCRASTSPPRWPTSNAARGRRPTRWRPSPP